MIRRPPLKQLNDRTPHTPDIRCGSRTRKLYDLGGHPVRSADHLRLLIRPSEGAGRDTEVRELDGSIFGRQDIRAFYIPVYYTLVVEVLETLEDLCHIDADEIFWKFAISLADGVQGTILAVPAQCQWLPSQLLFGVVIALLEDDVQTVLGLDEANILDDVVVVEVLKKVDLGLSFPRQQTTRPLPMMSQMIFSQSRSEMSQGFSGNC